MAWDTTKVASVDIVQAADWNNMVIDQKTRAIVTYGSSEPSTPQKGDLWYEP